MRHHPFVPAHRVHALRGWPTPLGVTFNPSAGPLYDEGGGFHSQRDAGQIELLARQVLQFTTHVR